MRMRGVRARAAVVREEWEEAAKEDVGEVEGEAKVQNSRLGSAGSGAEWRQRAAC